MVNDSRELMFQNWLCEHSAAVLKVARAYTGTSEDCQDLAQEILLQVWRSLPRFEDRSSASTWCYRVALNTALGWQRQAHRRRTHQCPLIHIEQVLVDEPSSSEEIVQRETVERLYAAIRQLPKTVAALVLMYLDDLSYQQIGEVLGISETNVGVKLSRAKKKLAELMKE